MSEYHRRKQQKRVLFGQKKMRQNLDWSYNRDMGTKLHRSKEPKLLAGGRAVDSTEQIVPPVRFEPEEAFGYMEEIHVRAETISPVLQEFLDMRPPSHWGINE